MTLKKILMSRIRKALGLRNTLRDTSKTIDTKSLFILYVVILSRVKL